MRSKRDFSPYPQAWNSAWPREDASYLFVEWVNVHIVPSLTPNPLLPTCSFYQVTDVPITLVSLFTQVFQPDVLRDRLPGFSICSPPGFSKSSWLLWQQMRDNKSFQPLLRLKALIFPLWQARAMLLWNSGGKPQCSTISLPLPWHFSWLFHPYSLPHFWIILGCDW